MQPSAPETSATRLAAEDLHRPCDPASLPFDSSADAEIVATLVGQERALEAVRFGISIRREGYNLFAIGPHGVGKQSLLRQYLDPRAADEPTPSDWCFVTHPADPHRPRALELPPGLGARLRDDLRTAIEALGAALRAVFQSDEYRTQKLKIAARAKEREDAAFSAVQQRARERGVAIARAETGVVVAPLHDGAPISEPEFEKLPHEEHQRYATHLEEIGLELQAFFAQVADWDRETADSLTALDRKTAADTAHAALERIRDPYRALPVVMDHLSDVERDVVDHASELLGESGNDDLAAVLRSAFQKGSFGAAHRYAVNLLVDNGGRRGAPVVYEDNPTHANLFGRIDSISHLGATVTDTSLIRAGALHRARGGYLLLDALNVLKEPFAWETLKRVIRSREIKTEMLAHALGITPTLALEPQPIPLGETKIVLIGEPTLYYLLGSVDPDLPELFKVLVDFEETIERAPETQTLYANLLASLASKERTRHVDRGAVARLIERAARLASDQQKLSVHMRRIVDLLREADYWAGETGHATIGAEDVERALVAQSKRVGRLRELMREATRRGTLVIETTGRRVGQINGLSVIELGDEAFGRPTRISASARMGRGEVVDIEREVELGGPIHSKGVLILGSYLGSRYALRVPLSLKATVVFEQSYGAVEGDSASLAELCALLSAIADVPLRQSWAVTGSVDQHGHVQAIGGVNEKIEGFFDACSDRGLTGDQGVIIPRANVRNLMLRRDVVHAVSEDRFHVHAVEHVDQAIAILSDRSGPGALQSFHALVESRLSAFAEDARAFARDNEEPRPPG